ncbi:hypothetical protein TSTA_108740 [Talaromyces stipitatus ATCC 10500]|uniref:C2H2-type domain-containing protein n=1 Tax=Talaromyces stipitatus (strain ATCC 10500 / CBS 375.48 / QM 6759 / NRRL 1006) TaxID=441959 RepID=B8MUM0_TALSN|nr:uncharacterized protein TSTA_108740 [Talaromyces stipitatus ATCC 10500]EED11688.1 hypothetical protein TSTA_108740 [Talaromyces stipitatus ATCC 10500]
MADVSPQHFAATKFRGLKPLWVVWGKKTEEGTQEETEEETAKETKELNSFLEDHGISVADAPHILPLRYGLFEVWFEENRRAELQKLFSETYTDFDENSPLVRFQGYCESLRIVLDAYKKQSNFWGGLDKILTTPRVGIFQTVPSTTSLSVCSSMKPTAKTMEYVERNLRSVYDNCNQKNIGFSRGIPCDGCPRLSPVNLQAISSASTPPDGYSSSDLPLDIRSMQAFTLVTEDAVNLSGKFSEEEWNHIFINSEPGNDFGFSASLKSPMANMDYQINAQEAFRDIENTEPQEADESLRQTKQQRKIDTPDQYASNLWRCQHPKCSKRGFRTKANLLRHSREVHRAISDLLRCRHPQCSKHRFKANYTLLRHNREVHKAYGHTGFLCLFEQCDRATSGRAFPRRWNCYDHMRKIHHYTGSYDDFLKSQGR